MRNFSKFEICPIAKAVSVLLSLAAATTLTQAGPGFGDAYDLNNTPFIIQSYFASSPAGTRQWTPILGANGLPMNDATGKPMLAPDSYDPANRIAYDAKVKQFYPNGYPGTGKALRKFIDPLPLLGAANAKTMADGVTQKYIPVALPSKWRNPQGLLTGDDYYEIAAIEYTDRLHSDLKKPTTLRGYVQIDHEASNGRTPLLGSKSVPLLYPSGLPIMINGSDANGKLTGLPVAALAFDNPHYLGPIIQANKDIPTRIKFLNLLPVGRAVSTTDATGLVTVSARNGDLFLPVDPSIVGAGLGQDGLHTYTQNRTNIHLHGGDSPWISDGGPHTWITPAGEADATNTASLAGDATLDPTLLAGFLRGPGALNVPDMNEPGPGAMTYYYPNGQSARMEWYHDHTVGITRLNAYAGLASAYLLTDPTEQAMIAAGQLPGPDATIPLILQDKSFVPDDIAFQDGRWNTSAWGAPGDMWFPHVYETVQDPGQATNFNSVGRWHWGPWFWPSYPALYNLPSGAYNDVTTTPEAWNDTPLVNGVAYPTLTVEPKPYRLRLLNAANDRTMSVNMFVADGSVTTDDGRKNTEVKMVPVNSWVNTACADPAATRSDGVCTPATWSTDVYGHNGGVPDATTQGPTLYQIANEGGLLPGVAVKEPTPTAFLLDKGRAAVLNVDWGASGLTLGNAERADVIVDFSAYAGKTLIVYNDSGAPVPAADPRNEYFTGYGDNSATGGSEDTRPGYGPNSRTMMQIVVGTAVTTPAFALNPATLDANIKTAYKAVQETPVVAQSAYNAALGTSWNDSKAFASIFDGSIKSPAFNFVPGTPSLAFNAFLINSPGFGYTRLPSVTLSGGGGTGATASAAMKIDKVNIVNGGSGYKLAPIVTLTSLAGGSGATATAALNVSAVQVVSSGSGYSVPPTIIFGKPLVQTLVNGVLGYNTATGVAQLNSSGGISGVIITNPGDGYTSAPSVLVTGAATVAARLTSSSSIASINLDVPDPTNANSAGGGGYVDLSTTVSEPNNPTPGMTVTIGAPTSVGGVTATASLTGKIFNVTLNNAGSGYTSAPTVSFVNSPNEPVYSAAASTASNYTPYVTVITSATATADTAYGGPAQGNILVKTKAIQELFDATYGRLNATFGVEIPYTSALTQTTIPLGYVDAPTEEISDGETQIWKITHNGVDAHPIHFHLVNVQLINRVGWDNFVTPPEPNELGWKETIKMSPLEDVIVAVRAKKPKLGGFGLRNSVRLLDPSQPDGAMTGFTQIDPYTGLPAPMANAIQDFGWEYVWHCHILGHEENDFMRPIIFHANEAIPLAPSNVFAQQSATAFSINWADNASTEYAYRIDRAPIGSSSFVPFDSTLANATQYSHLGDGAAYQYKVVAVGQAGEASSGAVSITVPAAPTNLTAPPRTTSATVVMSWRDNSTNETSFTVNRSADNGLTWTAIATVASTGTAITGTGIVTYSDTNALIGSAYQYQVFAVNATGTSAASNTLSVAQISPPVAPTALTAAVRTTSATVVLNWTDNANNESSFTVNRSINGGLTWTAIASIARTGAASTGVGAVTYSDTTALANTAYTYQVVAVNASGNSVASNNLSVAAIVAPAAPTTVTATLASATSVTLRWTDASATESYFVVQRAPVTGGVVGTFANVFTLNMANGATTGTVQTYTDLNLVTGSTYAYRVVAANVVYPIATPAAASISAVVQITPQIPLPAAPTALTAAARTTSATVALSWTDNSTNEASFTINRSSNGGVTWTAIGTVARTGAASTGVGAVTYNDLTALANTAYSYQVLAVNVSGSSAPSNLLNVAAIAAPAAPAPVTAVVASPTSVTISWTDASTTETSFVVQRAPVTAGVVGAFATVTTVAVANGLTTGGLQTFTNTGLVTGTTYAYRVVAASAFYPVATPGATSTSAVVQVTPVLLAPTAPSLLTAAARTTAATVVLSWTDNSTNEASFTINRSSNGGVTWTAIGTVARTGAASTGVGAVTYNDLTALANTAYSYQVLAVNVSGSSAPSNLLNVAAIAAPAAPAPVTAVVASPTSVTISWTDASTTETSFVVQRAPVTAGVVGAFATVTTVAVANGLTTGGLQTFTNTGLVTGTTYAYRVIAASAIYPIATPGATSTSAVVQVTPNIALPAAPSLLTAAARTTAATVVLNWTDNSTNETSFTINRSVNAGVTWTAIGTVARTGAASTGVGAVTYSDATALAGTAYSYQVLAVNAGGNSAASNSVSVAAIPGPAAPTGVTAIRASATSATIRWVDASTNETSFVVQRATVTGGVVGAYATVIAVASATGAATGAAGTFISTGLTTGTTYSFRVVAANALYPIATPAANSLSAAATVTP